MDRTGRKVSVIGAGMVGATLAQRVFESGLADVVLIDIFKNIAAGKAIDLLDASPITHTERTIVGTDDYSLTKGSDIVVITAGLPRRPGMTREDLIAKNASIVKDVSSKIKTHSPHSIVIVVTNPLDTMTYLAFKTTGFGRKKVFGMAGTLDSSRLIAILADELKVPRSSVETQVLGSHGDTMVPLISMTRVSGRPIDQIMPSDRLERAIQRTRDRGAEVVSLLGSGSAFYSPSAATFSMIKSILTDTNDIHVVSVVLEGEYGLKDICIGVPCKLGSSGISQIIVADLSGSEREAFNRSAAAIKSSIDLL